MSLKKIINWSVVLIFILFFCLWAPSQPFFSIRKFKRVELNYRQWKLFKAEKNLRQSEQLLSALHSYPEDFLRKLRAEYGSGAQAETQFHQDEKRLQAALEIARERKRQCEEDIKWIAVIERQIVGE